MDRRGLAKTLESPSLWLRPLLTPLTLLYGMISLANRLAFQSGLRGTRRLPRPVVSVGNISVGGSGKTPLVIWLASRLRSRGIKVAILTRGYGGSHEGKKGEVLELHDSIGPGAGQAGDEPTLMASKLPDIPILVCPDRYHAGMSALDSRDVDLFLLDDGFQHYSLHRDLDIVVIDDERRLGNGRLLPSGNLREPATRLKDADLIVVTKTKSVDNIFAEDLKGMTEASISWASYVPLGLILPGEARVLDVNEVESIPLLAFSGIANPYSFESTLRELPLTVVEHVHYQDHHPYSQKDVNSLYQAAGKAGARALITTEKDLMRWPGDRTEFPCYALQMEAVFLSGSDRLLTRVLALTEIQSRGAADG